MRLLESRGTRRTSGGAAGPTAEVRPDGSFEFAGVAAGEVVLTASQPDYLPATSPAIEVLPGQTVRMSEPLVLRLPATLELFFTPPTGPGGRAWRFRVSRLDPESARTTTTIPGEAGEDGIWVKDGLEPGLYQIALTEKLGARSFSEEIELPGGRTSVPIELPILAVEGQVLLGGEPLAARVHLSRPEDKLSASFQSDETGFFRGLLPEEGTWRVRVDAPAEGIKMTLDPVEEWAQGSSGLAVVDILLPGTELEGEVTDLFGNVVAGAWVRIQRRGAEVGSHSSQTDEQGRFRIRGLAPGDELLLFVTDHGTKNEEDLDNGAISLWQEELSVAELREHLRGLRPGVRVTMVMSQCYSGTFAGAIYVGPSQEPTGGLCGFFSTTRERKAYGCYPEGQDRDEIGHAFRFIEALERQETTAGAHLEVLVTDYTPDIPLRTSDLYLEQLLAEEAASRSMELDGLVDLLLADAWQDRAAWEPEIRLLDRIGDAFGTFSPRSLAELDYHAQQLPDLIERMKTYGERWKTTLVAAKEENLRGFTNKHPSWESRLEENALEETSIEERQQLLTGLLAELETETRERQELWSRLEHLRERATRASEAAWRLEVRMAALQRMRSVLLGVAGRFLLSGKTESGVMAAERAVLENLVSCEAMAPGALASGSLEAEVPLTRARYPSLADERELLSEILPSWLGVRFGPVPADVRRQRGLTRGATLLRAVYPDSPAQRAGLEAGDILLGPPGQPFRFPGELREWTMTSPRDTALELLVRRPGARQDADRQFTAMLYLQPLPLEWPELPGPPQVGDPAPPLPATLEPVESGSLPELERRSHVLFFWATWCQPCQKAVPELMAFAAANGVPVLAISDEDAASVESYLRERREGFFTQVAVDQLRKSFITYGVSGTPTIVLVDRQGIVRHRQVGYDPERGLTIEGWSWSGS